MLYLLYVFYFNLLFFGVSNARAPLGSCLVEELYVDALKTRTELIDRGNFELDAGQLSYSSSYFSVLCVQILTT